MATPPVVDAESDRTLRECGCPDAEIDRCAHFDGKTLLLWTGDGCSRDCKENESLEEGVNSECVVVLYADMVWERCSCGGWVAVYDEVNHVYAGSYDLADDEFARAEERLLRGAE